MEVMEVALRTFAPDGGVHVAPRGMSGHLDQALGMCPETLREKHLTIISGRRAILCLQLLPIQSWPVTGRWIYCFVQGYHEDENGRSTHR